MSMTAAFHGVAERQRARFASERLENPSEEDLRSAETVDDIETGGRDPETAQDHDEGEDDNDDDSVGDEEEEILGFMPHSRTISLADLEEERSLARRRTSACVLVAAFVLFRLWLQAVEGGDFSMLLICIVGTSWTARWVRHNREREEELDRRIANYLANSEPGTTQVDRNDLRLLSFQAQLALAIMESQRQMLEGGFGNPDGNGAATGVSEESKKQWKRLSYKEGCDKSLSKGEYGSVTLGEKKEGVDEGPSCSICLGEYEDGEVLCKLPCAHIYHEDCIGSWTENHTKCPLCNLNLDSTASDDTTVSSTTDGSVV